MALPTEFWVKRPNQTEIMSTNMAAGQERQQVELDENDIYGKKLMKDVHLLIKVEAIRQLKCREHTNLSDFTLRELKTSKLSMRFATLFHCCHFDGYYNHQVNSNLTRFFLHVITKNSLILQIWTRRCE